jgi:hypothetical protein
LPYITGFVCGDERLCRACYKEAGEPNDASIILDYEEFDSPPHCDNCHGFLGGALTTHGFKELCTRILEGSISHRFISMYLNEYGYAYDWDIMPTFLGPRHPLGN